MSYAALWIRAISLCGILSTFLNAEQPWSQFRGQNAAGHAGVQPTVPQEFSPDKNLLWKCPLVRGLSSPCVSSQYIYLTSFARKKSQLNVICIDRESGQVKWQSPIVSSGIEKVHKISSPANATMVANDDHAYAYFASCGLFCFDREGEQIWAYPLPVSKRFNGSGTSPIIVGDKIILNREDDHNKFLVALDAQTGQELWKTTHPESGGSFGEATPVLWNEQIILHRLNQIAAFSITDGKLLWTVPLNTNAASTPVISNDVLYVLAWNNFGEPELKGRLPAFDKLLKKHDKDADGLLSRKEMPWGPSAARRPEIDGRGLGGNFPVKFMFHSFDKNRDGKVSKTEWTNAADLSINIINRSAHGLTAIQLPTGANNSTPKTLWNYNKSIPEVPSPIVVDDLVYMVKNGGILTCLEKATGKVKYRRRLNTPGPYCASLVTVNDQIIAASADGVVTVFQIGKKFELLFTHDFEEPILSTPAICGGTLFVRTDKALYAFRKQQ